MEINIGDAFLVCKTKYRIEKGSIYICTGFDGGSFRFIEKDSNHLLSAPASIIIAFCDKITLKKELGDER